ncbi:MAG: carboxyvinyl-carboxyphosphonate phosphorylmutase [Alphaproteobacteria bacterium]|nr:carboxyvinyl-carboxyphosphonate phosphorylmutase [Alphaproteobacteria bacterium]
MDLKKRLSRTDVLLAPGIYDAMGAHFAARAGFESIYLSGASIAYATLGRPDIGLVTASEVAATIAAIRDRVDLALVVDADTGYGNALNVQRTVRTFERAGANAIQLEDQTLPKRCGHMEGKSLVTKAEMVGKLKAALDARESASTLIIARTDAIAVEGFEPALERAAAYATAGADILFVEAPRTREQLAEVAQRLGNGSHLMANMVEGGKTPLLQAKELEELGFSFVIFPSGLARALAHTMERYFATLKRDGTTQTFRPQMFDFDTLQDRLETSELLARGKSYDADRFEP